MFAGLWDSWTNPDGNKAASCAIVTTVPNILLEPIHDRVPVILPPDARREWLSDGDLSIGDVRELRLPYDPSDMELFEVSKAVDQRSADGPDLIAALDQ